jgi:hypothetical protein
MSTSWHLKDGIYGMIDPDNNLRPAATVFTWANTYLVGDVVKSTSDHAQIEALAVHQRNGNQALLLINKSAQPTQLTLQFVGKHQTVKGKLYKLNRQGMSLVNHTNFSDKALLEGFSLVLMVSR